MTATYTFDVFSTLDGFGSYNSDGDWGGYWSKEGPEFVDHRLTLYSEEQRLILGANTFREFLQLLARSAAESDPTGPPDEDHADHGGVVDAGRTRRLAGRDLVSGDAVDVIAQLKKESDVPLRSHGSLSLNRALMAAGLVDRVQVSLFPVVSGQTGSDPIFRGAADFDLELIESRTFDGRIQELIYRPTLH